MRLLVIGKSGQVGYELQRALQPLGEVVALGRHELDLSAPQGIATVLDRHRPEVVVNAGAYTAVDRAETDADGARAVNHQAVAALAEAARGRDALLVHYSTDYVFAGTGSLPYRETDPTDPQNVYGRTKRDGEEAVTSSGCRHLVLRTSWVHASRGANFARLILRLAKERDALSIVADQVGAPTSAELIADVTAHCIRQAMASPSTASGIYHLAAAGETSWCDYARFIVETALAGGVALKLGPTDISPIASGDYPQPARRPANSRLDTSRLRDTFGLSLPDWRVGVARTVRELSEGP